VKLAGKKIEGANVEYIVLPRGDGEPLVLKAQAILDYSPFEKLCPVPRPPAVMRAGGVKSYNVEDPRYVGAVAEHSAKRSAWIVLTSLRLGTPDLEWETVDYGDPNTWLGYIDELRAAGFSEVEIIRIVKGAMVANALDDAKLDAARRDFLASLERQADQLSSPEDGLNSTPSGAPANDSACGLPA
jgi:hypothetical protein